MKGSVKITSLYEGDLVLHDENGELTADGITVLKLAQSSPAEHRTVDLQINAFKKFLKDIPMLSKKQRSKQIKEYKQKAWADYIDVIGFKGSFPTFTGA